MQRINGVTGAQVNHPNAQPVFCQEVRLADGRRVMLRAGAEDEQDIQGMDHGTTGLLTTAKSRNWESRKQK